MQNLKNSLTGSSRVSLYMLREQFSGCDFANIQHAQDNFLVNACKINCKLLPPTHLQKENEFNNLKLMEEVTNALLPLHDNEVTYALNTCKK